MKLITLVYRRRWAVCDAVGMEFKPRPDRTVESGNPRTIHIYGPFKVKNRFMRKKHGTVLTAVQPFGSVNRDLFTRFKQAALF